MKFSYFLLFPLFLYSIEPTEYQIISDAATLPILTPSLAQKKVEKLQLKNGMHVYLISDPGADQSAAALAVESGSWDDPKEYPGMAHFLEHMLFMGTEAYPEEDAFMSYVFDHGGKVNAFTMPDKTVYMFSVNNETFHCTLDRFSHFFIDPLLSPHCIDRELHAVDQEHAKNIEHDGWRQYMIFKETGNPNHPHATFSTGNAKTLGGIPQKALKNWYESYYSADRMHLTLLSPLPLETLRGFAVQAFSSVKCYGVPDKLLPMEFTSSLQRGAMFFIKPVKEIKQLSLAWEVPAPFAADIEKQAPYLVAYALNREGKDTLIHTLKEEKIAEGLHASIDRFSKNALLFSIDIALTEKGLSQIHVAIKHVFEALQRLRKEGYPSYLFDEIHTMCTLNYQYQSRDDAFSSIITIASQMPYENLETFPEKTHIPSAFDPHFIAAFLDTLQPSSCLYSVLADPEKTGIHPNKKEQWMNAEYTIRRISKNILTAWEELPLNPHIQLPSSNPYLPETLTLIDTPLFDSNTPIELRNDEKGKVYYLPDTRYKVPEIAFEFTFKSPLFDNSALSCVLLDLYTRTLNEKLSEVTSYASAAGLEAEITADSLGLHLGLKGFHDKAPLLLNVLFNAMKELSCSASDFEIYKTSLLEDYNNSSKELPVIQAVHQLNQLLVDLPADAEKAAAISTVTLEKLNQFSSELFSSAYMQAILYGNLSEEKARELEASLSSLLIQKGFPLENHYKEKILLLSENNRPRKIIHSTERQGNGVLLLLQEGPFSFEKRAIQQILGTALADAFFDTLRTKQQTAYFVKAWNIQEQWQLLQYFAVQSSTHSASDLLARFELFLEDFDKNLKIKISPERFESLRDNLITVIAMPPENMALKTYELNKLAFEYEDFSWIEKRIDSLRALSYENFCKTAHTLLSRSNSRRLAVLMEGVLPPENDFRYEQITKNEIDRLGAFVQTK